MLTTVGSATVGLLVVSNSASGAKPKILGPADLTKSQFDPVVGSSFTVQSEATHISLMLVKVEGGKPLSQKFKINRLPFSLTFQAAPGTAALAGGIYSLAHKTLGLIAGLFLSPIGRPSATKGRQYQAVFT
jgi:hypothetical protein